jgi:glycosyltransferase involved in cell wall biosynthesis
MVEHKKPLVSVGIITYNHEAYIAKAIESVLMQQVNFEVELIIGEDQSKDGTRAICESFKTKYPDKIQLLTSATNVGVMENAIRVFEKCNGKYLAILEGDDYWLTEDKLQKQVDFLESHPDFALCFHSVEVHYDDGTKSISSPKNVSDKTEFTLEDLAKGNFLQTVSVLYRNDFKNAIPSWFRESPVGDYVLYMMHARNGKVKYLDETLAVYREHAGGMWSTLKRKEMLVKFITVLELLLREEFNETVIASLLEQKRNKINELLIANSYEDWDQFLKQLEYYSGTDEVIARYWLTKHLPGLIYDLRNSGTYKLGQRLQRLFYFWKPKK